jgi:multiple sugar transport system permease protein
MGYASALSCILLVIVLFFTALAFKSSNAWVYYESGGKK